ncbi:major facilitator superfamily domain-containing protein [Gigaspora rosea]|uniref:Major facilitator superfamily domain-containing protein n=1 Tax=Gigaspora rosea TaxID=44941 RepID=A0A397V8Y2_9GLOM|nr:major facilitator superfamily domain-containing protein [Gigaspora rosea]CAG8649704.1 10057_t:CDS:2 [Gigaspora rosea]
MASLEGEREIMAETVNEYTSLLSNNETSNSPILKKPWYKTPSPYWAIFFSSVNALSFGLIMTTKVEFYVQSVCKQYYNSKENPSINYVNNTDKCNIPEIQAFTSQLMMVLSLCLAMPGIFLLVPLGALSDRRGRRIILLMSCVGRILDVLCIILVGNYMESLGIGFLIIGTLLDGFTGSFPSVLAATHAYATDCTPPERRRIIFGLMHGGLLLSIGIGPVLGGMLTEFTNDILSTFYVSITTSIILFFLILFIVPESLSKKRQLDNRKRQLENDQHIFKKILNIFTPLSIFFESVQTTEDSDKVPAINARKYSLLSTAGISFMFSIAIFSVSSVLLLYVRYKFEWSLVEQGYLYTVICITRVFILLLVFPIVVKLFKERQRKKENQIVQTRREDDNNVEDDILVQDEKQMNKELTFDLWVIRFGIILEIVAFLVFGMATDGATFFTGIYTGAAGIIATPTLKSLQTNLVSPSQTGQLLGALSVLESISNTIGPLIINTLYSILVIEKIPHLIWYGVSMTYVIAFLFSFGIRAAKNKNRNVEMGDVVS